MTLYVWLKFFHLAGLTVFLFGHGVSGFASLALRGPVTANTRTLLGLSQRSAMVSTPALLVILITGLWMTFAGHWATNVWPWAALVVLVVVSVAMGLIARPYYLARDASKGPDDVLAQKLSRTRPALAVWVGGIGLLVLLVLMVFKPF
ncbi:MAG TPA: hypothetical protein VJQ08_03210 [Candidatus Dormibacteraeota bacterium]|nr:hypothetical protein [Candidatus Dormibacteraeota bacterium]